MQGTVKTVDEFKAAVDAGAKLVVSPGCTDRLAAFACQQDVPFLPGAATVSELMRLSDFGFRTAKLFPVEPMGGLDYVDAIAGPLPDYRLCVSGGINQKNFQAYLKKDTVLAVSGGWLTAQSGLARASQPLGESDKQLLTAAIVAGLN